MSPSLPFQAGGWGEEHFANGIEERNNPRDNGVGASGSAAVRDLSLYACCLDRFIASERGASQSSVR